MRIEKTQKMPGGKDQFKWFIGQADVEQILKGRTVTHNVSGPMNVGVEFEIGLEDDDCPWVEDVMCDGTSKAKADEEIFDDAMDALAAMVRAYTNLNNEVVFRSDIDGVRDQIQDIKARWSVDKALATYAYYNDIRAQYGES